MNIKNENAVINDKNLDAVTGGSFTPNASGTKAEITVNDFSAEMTSKAKAGGESFNNITIGDITGTL